MSISVTDLQPTDLSEYEVFVKSLPHSMLYQGVDFKSLLEMTLDSAKSRYLLAKIDGRIVGALPLFVMSQGGVSLVNSLPFYGSHGSVITTPDHAEAVYPLLMERVDKICREFNALTCTLIASPLDPCGHMLPEFFPHDFVDTRTGQLSDLRGLSGSGDVREAIMSNMHVKSRNALRKSLKSGFSIETSSDGQALESLWALHAENMESIGGLAKPRQFFMDIPRVFDGGSDYQVLRACRDGETAASLLVFYWNRVAEYFTPTINPAFRSEQPLSSLILASMECAVERGLDWWNWGGTWKSQQGVYRFKSRWGAQDIDYRYFIKSYRTNEELRSFQQSGRHQSFPYFYAFPFGDL